MSDFRQQLHDLCVTHGMTKEQVDEIAQATVDMAAATGDTAEHVAALLLMALRTDLERTAIVTEAILAPPATTDFPTVEELTEMIDEVFPGQQTSPERGASDAL